MILTKHLAAMRLALFYVTLVHALSILLLYSVQSIESGKAYIFATTECEAILIYRVKCNSCLTYCVFPSIPNYLLFGC